MKNSVEICSILVSALKLLIEDLKDDGKINGSVFGTKSNDTLNITAGDEDN